VSVTASLQAVEAHLDTANQKQLYWNRHNILCKSDIVLIGEA
jgi:hypothetical protein